MVNCEVLMRQVKHIEAEMLQKTRVKTRDTFCQQGFKQVINEMCQYCAYFKRATCTPRVEAVVNERSLGITFDGHKCFVSGDEKHLAKKVDDDLGILLTGEDHEDN